MRYVNLGDTGLRVSRICLGMMSYGKHESREWALDEKAAEGVTAPVVGATKLEHLDDALAAEKLTLSDSEISALEEPYLPYTISGH
jgi:aryl-alcohol dehydrogenase-like predicted oxidoreductase